MPKISRDAEVYFLHDDHKPLAAWLRSKIPNHELHTNVQKDKLPEFLGRLRGSILFIPSRYEGFSLSLIEGLSQGLIPVTYPVGVAASVGKALVIFSKFAQIREQWSQAQLWVESASWRREPGQF